MSGLSRRALLRGAGASAAVVPAVALGANKAFATTGSGGGQPDAEAELDAVEAAEVAASGPVMVFVSDAERGDVSILQGTNETVVRDRRLVAKIVRAGTGARKT